MNEAKVICISGKARHGKDTVAEILKNELEMMCNRVLITHYADLVKYICKMYFSWDGNKDEYGRGLLQYIGTDLIREKNPDYWVGFIVDMLGFFGDRWDYVLIPDARFDNEISVLCDAGLTVYHVHVDRGKFNNELPQEQDRHPSELGLTHTPDFVMRNDGSIDDLVQVVQKMADSIVGAVSREELAKRIKGKDV